MNTWTLTFAGAADTVTGSRHLLQSGNRRVLLDCGLFQGYKTLRERNWAPFTVRGARLDAIIVSHAHLDHSGYLPVLVRDGFRGPIYVTPATRDLCEVMLLDSAHLLEEEARRANRYGYTRHAPALPLYTLDEAKRCLDLLQPVDFDTPHDAAGLQFEFVHAGHLLGAASVRLRLAARTLLFSGDLGRDDDLLMPPPAPMRPADVLLVESTYGNRLHPRDDVMEQLATIVRDTVRGGGSVLMPSFAVGRAQALLLGLLRLKRAQRIPDVPVFVDSPMASKATQIHLQHHALLRIDEAECRAMIDGARFVATPEESKALSAMRYPAVIIAASGMATGGRVLHHLKALAPHPQHHVVFPGFQVPGTRGAKLVAGEPTVRLFGEDVPVRARVSHLEGYSGHADANGLMQWLRGSGHAPEQTFVIHGERASSDALRSRIQSELRWAHVRVPEHMESVTVAEGA